MRHIIIIVNNFYKQTFDKPKKYLYFFGLPLISFIAVFLLFGQQGTTGIIDIGVINEDRTLLSSSIIAEIEKTEGYSLSYLDKEGLEDSLISDEFDAVIFLPSGFEDSLNKTDKITPVIYSIKNEGITVGLRYIINDYISSFLVLQNRSVDNKDFVSLLDMYNNTGIKVNKEKIVYENSNNETGSRALGFLLLFIFGQGMTITSLILKNRENRTFSRLKTAPISEVSYFTGNLLSALIILFLQVLVGLLFATVMFKFNFLVLIPLLLFYSIAIISLGLFVTSISKNQNMANNINILLMAPLCMLGGCFWSVKWMPMFMQKISLFVPQYWAMEGIERAVSGDNTGFLMNISILIGFTFLFLSLFILRVKNMSK